MGRRPWQPGHQVTLCGWGRRHPPFALASVLLPDRPAPAQRPLPLLNVPFPVTPQSTLLKNHNSVSSLLFPPQDLSPFIKRHKNRNTKSPHRVAIVLVPFVQGGHCPQCAERSLATPGAQQMWAESAGRGHLGFSKCDRHCAGRGLPDFFQEGVPEFRLEFATMAGEASPVPLPPSRVRIWGVDISACGPRPHLQRHQVGDRGPQKKKRDPRGQAGLDGSGECHWPRGGSPSEDGHRGC
jgi:hypothetical protein